jgi:hypothetical protein
LYRHGNSAHEPTVTKCLRETSDAGSLGLALIRPGSATRVGPARHFIYRTSCFGHLLFPTRQNAMPYPLAFGAEAWRSVDHDHGFSVKNLPLVACQPNPPKRGGLGWIGDCVKRQLLQQEIFRATPFTPTLISMSLLDMQRLATWPKPDGATQRNSQAAPLCWSGCVCRPMASVFLFLCRSPSPSQSYELGRSRNASVASANPSARMRH